MRTANWSAQAVPAPLYTNSIISILAYRLIKIDTQAMGETPKRTVQVNVKMSEEDFALLQDAARARWPEAIISNSGILLGLAKIEANRVLKVGN